MENNVAVADNRGRQTTEVEDTWRTKPIGNYKKYKSTEEYKRLMLRQINACLILYLVTSHLFLPLQSNWNGKVSWIKVVCTFSHDKSYLLTWGEKIIKWTVAVI